MKKVTLCSLAAETVPRQASAAERDSLAHRTYSQSSSPPKLVLVIDDSPTVRNILEVCLSRAGYQVKSFHDGVEALQWLVSPQACLPRLVFLDIGLPRMDGFEVSHYLKDKPQLKYIVIILISRRDGAIERLRARLVGAQDYIVKPITTQHILAVVQAHLSDLRNAKI